MRSMDGVTETLLQTALEAHQSGDLERAEALYLQVLALEAGNTHALTNLAATYLQRGRFEDSIAAFDHSLAIRPDQANAWSNRGIALGQLGRRDEALACFLKAAAIRPDHVDAHYNAGVILLQMYRHPEAVDSLRRTLQLRPGHLHALDHLGLALFQLNRAEEALAAFDAVALQAPQLPGVHRNRATALNALGRFDEALATMDHALSLQPDHPDRHYDRAVVLYAARRFDEALQALDDAQALAPNHMQSQWVRTNILLLLGRYEEGWLLAESRWKQISMSQPFLPQRLWQGEPVEGKTVLIHYEQGFGDMLQFIRYAPMLAARGARVIAWAPRPLQRLLAAIDGVAHAVTDADPLPDFDLHLPVMSLPRLFGTTVPTIPAAPYLHALPDDMEAWTRRLGPRTRLRVGLVWSGGHRPDQPDVWPIDARRNIGLATLAPLAHADIDFYSLQKGQPAEGELETLRAQGWDGPVLIDHTDALDDFADTAALIENLDLVITVDTSTAHLAAGMGKPVWLLNRFDTCWRWLWGRDDSPWYPSVRLFRQPAFGDWTSVVLDVKRELDALAAAHKT
jgi:tetratricopeptide (TPR) repeat protein